MIFVYNRYSYDNFLISHIGKNISIQSEIKEDNNNIIKKLEKHSAKYFLFHINLSFIKDYFSNKDELLYKIKKMGIKSINDNLFDIRKSTIQKTCKLLGLPNVVDDIKDDDNIIIKSDYNSNSVPEHMMTKEDKAILNIDFDTNPIEYMIFKKYELNNINLKKYVIEKFIENNNNLFYRVYKLYNKVVISEVVDQSKIKKMPVGIARTNYFYDLNKIFINDKFYKILIQVKILSEHMGIDYAAFDIVMSNNKEYYIIDINHTPYWGQITSEKDYYITNYLYEAIH